MYNISYYRQYSYLMQIEIKYSDTVHIQAKVLEVLQAGILLLNIKGMYH